MSIDIGTDATRDAPAGVYVKRDRRESGRPSPPS